MRRSMHIVLILLLGWISPASDLHGQAGESSNAVVEIQVYKKWIGASGDEANVEAQLVCDSGASHRPVPVNRDAPAIWYVADVPKEGMFCTVYEMERETFVADIDDCRDLLVLPDQGAECTLVNTKVVKRIDMLNRYGLVLMIAVMLGAGLAAVHRYGRV